MVKVDKQFLGKKPHTLVHLTDKGRKAIDQHWKLLEALHKGAQKWEPKDTDSGSHSE
jgi:DNA-binding MarR family transcriptional regulator